MELPESIVNVPTISQISIVGVGDMGGSIAKRAVSAGLPVMVVDLRADLLSEFQALGIPTGSSVIEAADDSDVMSVVVVNDAQVRRVFDEIMKAKSPPKIVIVHSTVLPSTITDLVAEGLTRGITVLDAAVSGGSDKAELGRLSLLIGGDASAIGSCRPYFESIAADLFYIGPAGSGSAAKLVNNILTIGCYAIALEAMQLAAAYGIDEDMVATFVPASSGDIRSIRTWGRYDRFRRYHAAAGTAGVYDLWSKDLNAGVAAASARGVEIPLVSEAASLIEGKLMARDAATAQRPVVEIPLCRLCQQELAPPFRQYGVHPECRPFGDSRDDAGG